jgi:hypothetical protein
MAMGRPTCSAKATTSSAPRPARGARGERSAHLLGDVAGGDLVAQSLDRLGRRADPDHAGGDDGAGELGVLGEEAVAGVHGVGAGAAGDREDLLDRQVGLGARGALEGVRLVGELRVHGVAVLVGVDGDRGLPESRAARITRTAISPRFATSTLVICGRAGRQVQ